MEICSKTHQITPFKIFCRGNMPPNPLANAWLRHTSQAASRHATRPAPPPQIVRPPLANPAYAHGLLLRNLFERYARRINAGRQLIVCSTLYVYALQNFLGGKK